jgi:ppGpp synthetase/RelA/SpoT-type nucleotidyltranferase
MNDAKWHKDQVSKYHEQKPVYDHYARVLTEILRAAAELCAPQAIVQARAKSVPSFAEKAIRKAFKYDNPVEQLTDLCGARIIVHFQEQVEEICRLIRREFEIDEANSLDLRSRLRTAEFGYLSFHFIVMPNKDEILGVKIPPAIRNKKAEIQIRTLLQHAWADMSHDRLYKSPIKVPEYWVRESARLAAIMENSDRSFARMAGILDAYTVNYAARMSQTELEQEITLLETILANETEEESKPRHALRLARIYKAASQWQNIIDILSPYAASASVLQEEIQIVLGHALCRANRGNPEGEEYKAGQAYLKKIAQPNLPVAAPSGTVTQEESPDTPWRGEALYRLGVSYSVSPEKIKPAYTCFAKAHQLDPLNPYYFYTFLEYEICQHKNRVNLSLVVPAILGAIERCREHISLGLELPKAYFILGKFHLLLQDFPNCFNACAKAIDLCLSEKVAYSQETFDNERDSLARLESLLGRESAADIQILKEILQLAKFLAFQSADAEKELRKRTRRTAAFQPPVAIIAGGADEMEKSRLDAYGRFLYDGLRMFEGTILAGGTTAGIPGLVGAATGQARRSGYGHYHLVGYLPGRMPRRSERDRNYDEFVITAGEDFSLLELLQYWVDLAMNGIKPSDVMVLGINGGRIAEMEYKMALMLGATVGLVESSGRAAARLLMQADWKYHERLLVLPEESEAIWAFLNQKKPSRLDAKVIETAAPMVHEYYRQERIRMGQTEDPSLLAWENLPANLQESNRRQAAFIEHILNQHGLAIRPKQAKGLTRFEKDLLLQLAQHEHARWIIERLNDGWHYGPVRDANKKISPYLVSWQQLPEQIRQYDIQAVQRYLEILEKTGYEIYATGE